MTSPQVATFYLPGHLPDTRITVFKDIVYHVHSNILKLYSAYFRKFMDSPDKVPAPAGSQWRYDWIEKLEEDGNWYLVAGDPQESKECPNYEYHHLNILAIENIIKAMYQQPYVLEGSLMLTAMTELADFYCCLPVVSNSLYAAFYRSPGFLAKVIDDKEILLGLAYKLRHRELFNDCLILISGYWPDEIREFTTTITDKKLSKLAEDVHNRMAVLLVHAHQSILKGLFDRAMTARDVDEDGIYTIKSCIWDAGERSFGSLIQYYKDLNFFEGLARHFPLDTLLKNNLKLFPDAVAGEGKYLHNFLFMELKEEDFPWDTTQTDW